ncbi:hypothetical protein TWF106_008603 [Orbilia oligospora]|uniref:FAD-binding domain-containing protein n=1 Tax=Orbilia oligospora TaxID=2813651 RepID=A0A7C8UGS0_ORBOL|nr:hypothetical protein TWF106_008603 [Orbilia oligospora]
MTTQLSDRVIIIGGGLAGLALAQGLQKADPPIPFHIFERDTSATYRAQGYRIRIWGDGADALKHLLPEHLWTAFEATCAQLADGARKLDALTNEVGEMAIPKGALPSGTPYNADRATLRSVLLAGLEDKISFGKVFEGYEVDKNTGAVSVQFADGTVEKGRILVGADGVRSVVRKSFLPELKSLDIITSGEHGKQLKLFSEAIYFNRGLEGAAGFELPPNYIYWVLCLRSDLVADGRLEERNFLNLDSTESVKLAGDLTADWNEKVRSVFDNQNPDATSTLSFFICDPENFKSSWENLRRERAGEPVVLLGDSAHPMPPVGAVGANTAFQEASDLFDTLVRMYNTSSPSSTGAEEELRNYETRLVDRAIESIRKSTAGAGNFWGMRPLAELKPAMVWR